MSVVQLKFYSGDDPNGSLLGTLDDSQLTAPKGQSKFECRVALRGFGSGQFSISQSHPSATSSLIRKGNYVRVVIPSIQEDPVWGFWLWEGDFSLLDINNNDTLTFKGPGPLGILRDAVLQYESQVADQPKRGSVDKDDLWSWINEPYGAILTRIIEEGRYAPFPDPAAAGSPLEPVTIDFDRVNDSASNPWPNIDGEYQQPIWANVLSVFEDLRDAGDMFVVSDPDFLVQAFQTYGTDRTSTSFASGKVRLTDTNILTGLSKHIHATQDGTHFGGRSKDGDYYIEEHPDYTSGRQRWITGDAPETNDDTLLSKLGQEALLQSSRNTDAFEAEVTPGDDEATGRYLPWTHYNIGDTITVDAGAGSYAYVDDDARIIAFRVVLAGASDDSTDDTAHRSLHTVLELNAGTSEGAPTEGRAPGTPGCRCPRPCNALTPGTESLFRFYTSSNPGDADPTLHGNWDADSSSGAHSLTTAPDSTHPSTGTGSTSSAGGDADGRNVLYGSFMSQANIGASLAAVLAAGGATVRGQFPARARYGIGISESSQHMIGNLALRVTAGATTTVRGTAYAPHTLTSSAGSVEWPAQSSHLNRRFPPVSASDVLTAVPGTVSTDRLVLELGSRNYTLSTSGGAIILTSDDADDLPEDESSGVGANAWIEIRAISAPTGSGHHPDLVGTDKDYARCDHKHHVLSNRDPTSADDITQGFPTTTLWTNTETNQSFVLVDEDTGDWHPFATAGEHTHQLEDIEGLDDFLSDDFVLNRYGGQHVVNTVAASGSSLALDLADGNVHDVTLDDDCTFTFAGPTSGVECRFRLIGHWAGFTPTFPGSVIWPDDTEPTWSTDADAVDVVEFLSVDGGTTWYGDAGGAGAGAPSSGLHDEPMVLPDGTVMLNGNNDPMMHEVAW